MSARSNREKVRPRESAEMPDPALSSNALEAQTAGFNPCHASNRITLWRDRAILGICKRTLAPVGAGRVRLTLPSGTSAIVGTGGADTAEADLALDDFSVFWQSLRRGSIGFADAFMDGGVHTHDLGNLFRFFLDNRRALKDIWAGQFRVRGHDKAFHQRRTNTRENARDNISHHYDLGNEFYAPWLDASMTYSSALFTKPGMTLETAQATKIDAVIKSLELKSGMRVLEIGCGWGALAVGLAEAGARVTAITISQEQHDYTRRRIEQSGQSSRIDLQLIDYRDVVGSFDRIVSIEMIEAVGEEHWPAYFGTIAQRLKPGGHAIVQAITIAEAEYANYRSKADFIQRYIFPGGMLPTEQAMAGQAGLARLSYTPVLRFGASYAKTLEEWRKRFLEVWPSLAPLGFDERFRRMWIYYLTYCEVAFQKGATDVGLYRFCKPTV